MEQSSVFHLQGDRVDPAVLTMREDLLGTTSASSLVYLGLDGWRRQMVQHGKELLGAALALAGSVRAEVDRIPGLHLVGDEIVGPGQATSLDPMKVMIDVSGLEINGYQAADWLRDEQRITVGLSDHRRIVAMFTHSDNQETAERFLHAMRELTKASLPAPPTVDLPSPNELELRTEVLPRDAFFGPTEQVPIDKAVGRIAAEMLTPYPPGAPAVLPGEVITKAVLDYLRSGLSAGMYIPDAVDGELTSVRVVDR